MSNPRMLTSKDWLGKASAAVLLGFVLSLGLSGLLFWVIGANDAFQSPKGQLTMWSISPFWCLILAFCFFFRSPRQAWGVLALACLVVWLALYATGLLAGAAA